MVRAVQSWNGLPWGAMTTRHRGVRANLGEPLARQSGNVDTPFNQCSVMNQVEILKSKDLSSNLSFTTY